MPFLLLVVLPLCGLILWLIYELAADFNRVFIVDARSASKGALNAFFSGVRTAGLDAEAGLTNYLTSGLVLGCLLLAAIFVLTVSYFVARYLENEKIRQLNAELASRDEKQAQLQQLCASLKAQAAAAVKEREHAEQLALQHADEQQRLDSEMKKRRSRLEEAERQARWKEAQLLQRESEQEGLRKALIAAKREIRELKQHAKAAQRPLMPDSVKTELARLQQRESDFEQEQRMLLDEKHSLERALRFFARKAFPSTVKAKHQADQILELFNQGIFKSDKHKA